MKAKFILYFCLAVSAGTLSAQKILYSPEKQLGIRVPELSENRWNSRIMEISRRYNAQDLTSLDADFFTKEYGVPFIFHEDLLKRFGIRTSAPYAIRDKTLEFQVPSKGWSVMFGAKRGEHKIPAIRYGRGWGKYAECRTRLELVLEQDAEKTEWEFILHRVHYGKTVRKFEVQGIGKQIIKYDKIGMIRYTPFTIGGIELRCTTPGARVRIHSMRIVPYVLNISWRRKFRLDFTPVRGGISLYPRAMFDLTVNGEKVASGNHLIGGGGHGVMRIDISRQLRKGDNEIIYRGNFNGGYGPTQRLLQESFAIGKNGEVFHLSGDKNWEWSFDEKNWQKPALLGNIGNERQPKGNRIAEGSIPFHAGPLDIRHPGLPYPVFDYDKPIAYEVSIPSGIQSPQVKLTIRHPLTGKVLETLSPDWQKVDGNFRIFSAEPKLRETGAYQMDWELLSDGKVIDRTRTEMLICGPLKQDEVAFKDFETELSRRLEPIQKIDCTQEYGLEDFLDHSSHYSAAKLNLSRIIDRNGMNYRETGDSSGDFFAYKLNINKLGKPHIAEIIIPDNAERILYSTVNETYPVSFCNNYFSRGWPSASGSVMTGGLHPLSFKTKVMRYVFFPGSKNITISVENGKTGTRAAVCAINIYEVRGGLPALKLPETGRFFANYNERFLFNNWGSFVYPKIQEGYQGYFESAWTAAFYGIANRIAYLKFAGHNAAVEGSYMYSTAFPTRSGRSGNCWADFDYFYAMLKMYKHNGIRSFIGFEYMHSPNLNLENRYDVSDREIHAGTARSIHHVDRHGKQAVGAQGMGLNYLNPHVWNSIAGLFGEIYRKYEGIGGIEGLFIINGFWWLPGFTTPPGMTAEEIGYDDDSIEAFESDTGIRLNLPSRGRERFEKRHALLNGPHYNAWYSWRSRKMREKMKELAEIIHSGTNKWKLFAVPTVTYPDEHPFNSMKATAKERDEFQETYLKRSAFDPALYDGKDNITFVPKVDFDKGQLSLPRYGSITNRGTRKLYERNDAVYLAPDGLNERKVKATAAKKWWWKDTGICVYDLKPAGEFAFSDLVDVISGWTPKYMFHTWLDVNCTTAHMEESRRLLAGFYATPERRFEPFSGIRGIQAKAAGDHVQLVNDTPYSVSGTLTANAKAEDKVTGNTFTGTIRYEVRPFGISVIRIDDPVRNLSGSMSFDAETAELLRTQAETILNTRMLRTKIHPDHLSSLKKALAEKNDYRLCTIMRDFEVLSKAKRFFDSAPYQKNQNRLLQMLEKENAARINCGASTDYTDEEGKLWLPDQPYTGFNTYGSEFTNNVY